jgi:methyl-accepting chemotaxis protein
MLGLGKTLEARRRAAFDVLPVGVAVFGPDERCIYFNATYATCTDYPMTVGAPWIEIALASFAGLHAPGSPEAERRIAEVRSMRAAGQRRQSERMLGDRWVRITDDIVPSGGFILTVIDMTDLRKERLEVERRQHEASAARAELAAASEEQGRVVDILARGLGCLAAGDLEHRVTGDFPEGYQQLQLDFNAAVDQLQQAMQGISRSADGVQWGADEISQSADQLARRTEQQAATIQEAAAALDQVTEVVRRTADAAAEANAVVAAATADAQSSGAVVEKAVSAMGGIAESALQIGQIVSVIDEIAFQTNLLALNAGVEAARAGDAGRGFAVVASEVRALAQRSANAAKEIKGLIAASSQEVAGGVKLVGEAGQTLARILTQVAEINSLTAGIAVAVKDQALTLQAVNGSIREMDVATQQNSGLAQKSTAASAALVSEANQLGEMLGRFSMGEPSATASPSRRDGAARAPIGRVVPALRYANRA